MRNLHNALFLDQCLNLSEIEHKYYVNKEDINPSTGKQYAINPRSGVWDDNYWDSISKSLNPSQPSPSQGNTSSPSGSFNGQNALDLAKKTQEMQIQANQPAIATLNTQKNDLDSKYQDLLKSITGQQEVAQNAQIKASNAGLGARGLDSQSQLGAQEIASSLAPIASRYQGLTAQTGLSRQQDLTSLAAQVAGLQAGNLPNALGFASGIGSMENQANQFAQNLGLQQTAQSQNYNLANQNYSLEQQKLAQALAQQKIDNDLQRQGLGIQGLNASVNQGNLQLGRDQFNYNSGGNSAWK